MEKRIITAKPEWWYPYAITVPIGLFMFAWIALGENPLESVSNKPIFEQHSQGSNSPNIIGDHNTVTINPDSKDQGDKMASKDAFHVDLRIIDEKGPYLKNNKLVTDLMFGFKDVAYPIHYAFYIQVVNLQNVVSKISSYSLHASTDANGPWTSLRNVPVGYGDVYATPEGDTVQATAVLFEQDLERILGSGSLNPRETIDGWSFFVRCKDTPEKIKFFKFNIRDTAGMITETIVPLRRETDKGAVTFQHGSIKFLGRRDISKFQFKPSPSC